MLTLAENVTAAETIEKAASSVQSVSRKILARRKAAKERNSKVCVDRAQQNIYTYSQRNANGKQNPYPKAHFKPDPNKTSPRVAVV